MGRVLTRRIDVEAPLLMTRADYDRSRRAFYRVTGAPRLIGEDGGALDLLPKLVPPGSFVLRKVTAWEPVYEDVCDSLGCGRVHRSSVPVYGDPASDHCADPRLYLVEGDPRHPPWQGEGRWEEQVHVPSEAEAEACASLLADAQFVAASTAEDLERLRRCAEREPLVFSRTWVPDRPPPPPATVLAEVSDVRWTDALVAADARDAVVAGAAPSVAWWPSEVPPEGLPQAWDAWGWGSPELRLIARYPYLSVHPKKDVDYATYSREVHVLALASALSLNRPGVPFRTVLVEAERSLAFKLARCAEPPPGVSAGAWDGREGSPCVRTGVAGGWAEVANPEHAAWRARWGAERDAWEVEDARWGPVLREWDGDGAPWTPPPGEPGFARTGLWNAGARAFRKLRGVVDPRSDEWWYDTEWGQELVWFVPPVCRDEQGYWGPGQVMDLPAGDDLVLLRWPHPFLSVMPPNEGTVVTDTALGSGTFVKVRAPFCVVPVRKTSRLWYDVERTPDGHLGLSIERRRSRPSRWTLARRAVLASLADPLALVTAGMGWGMVVGWALGASGLAVVYGGGALSGDVRGTVAFQRDYYRALARGASWAHGFLPLYPSVVQEMAVRLQATKSEQAALRVSIARRNADVAERGGVALKVAQVAVGAAVGILVGVVTGGVGFALSAQAAVAGALTAVQAGVAAAEQVLRMAQARDAVSSYRRLQREHFDRATEEKVAEVVRLLQFERLELERELALTEELERLLAEPAPSGPEAVPGPPPAPPAPAEGDPPAEGPRGGAPVSADDGGEEVAEFLKKAGWALAILRLVGGR